MSRLIYSLLALAFVVSPIHAEDFTPPEYIEDLSSTRPDKTNSRSRLEGWAYLSYFIDEQGEATDIEVIDSSYTDKYTSWAIRNLKNLRYEPATYKGEPVPSANVYFFRIDRSFQSYNNDGLSGGFTRHYNDADNFMLEGKMEEARESLLELKEDHAKNLTEQALSSWLHSKFYFIQQQWPEYGSAVQRAHYLNRFLPTDMQMKNTQNGLKWYMHTRAYPEALDMLDTLMEVSDGNLAESDYHEMQKQITDLIKSTELNEIDITLADDLAWNHKVPRSTVGMEIKKGEVSFAQLRCQNGRQSFSSFPIKEFVIPAHFHKCRVFVKGEPGTQFMFTETGALRNY